MKIVIFKSYLKKSTVYFNYGDDCDETWHNFNAIENVREVTSEEFVVLKNAIDYFNSKCKRDYTLGVFVVMEDEELDSLLSDFKTYEKKAIEKSEKIAREKKEKDLAAKAKAESRKFDRTVTKLAKELNLPEDEVRARLMK